jgi:hypothetical protein
MTLVAAFVAFFALIVGWLAAPTSDERTPAVAAPAAFQPGDAHA